MKGDRPVVGGQKVDAIVPIRMRYFSGEGILDLDGAEVREEFLHLILGEAVVEDAGHGRDEPLAWIA